MLLKSYNNLHTIEALYYSLIQNIIIKTKS